MVTSEVYSRAYSRAYNEALLKGWMTEAQVKVLLEADPHNWILNSYPTVERIAQLADETMRKFMADVIERIGREIYDKADQGGSI